MKLLAVNDQHTLIELSEVTDDDAIVLEACDWKKEMSFSIDNPGTLSTIDVETWKKMEF